MSPINLSGAKSARLDLQADELKASFNLQKKYGDFFFFRLFLLTTTFDNKLIF